MCHNSDKNQNIVILCFGVDPADRSLYPTSKIETFDNPFKFISSTLSVKDKTIYLIISTNKGRSVIPVVHKHYCIEKIYLYEPIDTESSSTWSLMFEKFGGCYSDIKQIYDQITNDIKSMAERSLPWNRSFDLFSMLHTQRLERLHPIIKLSTNIPHDECIIIFHDDDHIFFDTEKIPFLLEFNDVNECTKFINEHLQSQIFLIIAVYTIPLRMQSILNFPQIYAIYLFHTNKLNCAFNKRKLSGLFHNFEDLAEQLSKDVLFYREQHNHTARIDVWPMIEQTQNLISQLKDEHIAFLTYNLFIDILPQTPSLEFKEKDFVTIGDILSADNGKEVAQYLSRLFEKMDDVMSFSQDPRFSQIVLKLHQLNKLNELFILQKQFCIIQKQKFESIEVFTYDSVYSVKIISNDTLKMLHSSVGGYINIGIFVLATKSLLTTRSIARQAANNHLISVLFEMDVNKSTHLLEVGGNRVLFCLGTVFCLKSISMGPDDVFHVKLRCANQAFRLIKEQVQFEINVKLSWLTYGNYLYFINRLEEGEAYFNYLLDKLPSKQIYQATIYNNMGLIYAKKCEEKENYQKINKEQHFNKAKMAYSKVLESVKLIESSTPVRRNEGQASIELITINVLPTNTVVDYSTAIANIADLHYKAKQYAEAMKFYMEALELSVDQQSSCYYQKKILEIREHLEKQETNFS